jgi:hypothetical protein
MPLKDGNLRSIRSASPDEIKKVEEGVKDEGNAQEREMICIGESRT